MNYLIKSFFILFILTFCVNCVKDNKSFNGEPLVEFSQNEVAKIISFTDTSEIVVPIKIQLVSKPLSQNKIIHFEVVDSNSALLGKHYVVKNYNIELKSGEVFADFNVIVKASNFLEGQSVSVLFRISSDSSQVQPSKNYMTCKLTLTKQSFIDVFVGSYKCDEPVNQDSYSTIFILGTEPYSIKNINFWNFPATGQSIIYTFSKDTSMNVKINEQKWIDKSGKEYIVSGNGKYDINGNMVVNYSLKYNGSIYESGIHTFTPISTK